MASMQDALLYIVLHSVSLRTMLDHTRRALGTHDLLCAEEWPGCTQALLSHKCLCKKTCHTKLRLCVHACKQTVGASKTPGHSGTGPVTGSSLDGQLCCHKADHASQGKGELSHLSKSPAKYGDMQCDNALWGGLFVTTATTNAGGAMLEGQNCNALAAQGHETKQPP